MYNNSKPIFVYSIWKSEFVTPVTKLCVRKRESASVPYLHISKKKFPIYKNRLKTIEKFWGEEKQKLFTFFLVLPACLHHPHVLFIKSDSEISPSKNFAFQYAESVELQLVIESERVRQTSSFVFVLLPLACVSRFRPKHTQLFHLLSVWKWSIYIDINCLQPIIGQTKENSAQDIQYLKLAKNSKNKTAKNDKNSCFVARTEHEPRSSILSLAFFFVFIFIDFVTVSMHIHIFVYIEGYTCI